MARGNQGDPTDWVTRAADDAIRHAHDRYGDDLGDHVITCASGASPSGPVHLGNLREFLTVHFVAEEIKRRGLAARHLHSWDDYDRFRKVPAGIDASWSDRSPAYPTRGAVTSPGPSTSRSRWSPRCASWASRWWRSPRPSSTEPAPTESRS